ncbi:MAG: lysophospholipase [Acidimicrobiia bacterium]|nr:lysophospholipase [Acidimicrobiia bacterium]MDH4365390.1 lysophospholipase [Acidimicrobiia bacterium]
MTEVVVSEQLAGTRDGTTQLQRRWQPATAASDHGPQGAGPRAAVVLVHGIGEHSGRYDHVGRFLAQRGHDVLAFDSRGHGQSGGRRGHVDHFRLFLDDVEDHVLERRQLGLPVVLIGHSLGGLISATYVVERRPAPDLLVLSAPALKAQIPAWQRRLAPMLSRVWPTVFVPGGIDGALLSRDPEVQRAYLSDPLRVAGSTARLGQQIFATMETTAANLDRITLPTYVLHGSDDQLVPPAASQPFDGLSNVTYRRWAGLRHECFNEPDRAEVLGEMAAWMEDQLADLPLSGDGDARPGEPR